MTKRELIEAMRDMDDDAVVTLHIGDGWSNVECVEQRGFEVQIHADLTLAFSDE